MPERQKAKVSLEIDIKAQQGQDKIEMSKLRVPSPNKAMHHRITNLLNEMKRSHGAESSPDQISKGSMTEAEIKRYVFKRKKRQSSKSEN